MVDAGRAEEILRNLSLLRPSIEGNRDALTWLRGEQSVFVPEENRERNVRLIDFAHPENNIFQVTDEWIQRVQPSPTAPMPSSSSTACPWPSSRAKSAEKKDGLAEGVSSEHGLHLVDPLLVSLAHIKSHLLKSRNTGSFPTRTSAVKPSSPCLLAR